MGVQSLPAELLTHISTFLDPRTLCRLEQTSKQWRTLIRESDNTCWSHHVIEQDQSTGKNTAGGETLAKAKQDAADGRTSLQDYIGHIRDRCIDEWFWLEATTWKDLYRRQRLLAANWKAKRPLARTSIVGYTPFKPSPQSRRVLDPPAFRVGSQPIELPRALPSPLVWRARLDTASDANFVILTFFQGGLRVVDASVRNRVEGAMAGDILWELPRWAVRQHAHLEYQRGICCWDSEDGIEVWKRWKLVHGTPGEPEPASKRGTFTKWATLPELPNTRGFMLNDDLHLTIVSSRGRFKTYDLSQEKKPKLLYEHAIASGATGHIEHDSNVAIFAMGHAGYALYEKSSGNHLGNLCFGGTAARPPGGGDDEPQEALPAGSSTFLTDVLEKHAATNVFKIDAENRLQSMTKLASSRDRDLTNFVRVKLQRGALGTRRTPATTGIGDLVAAVAAEVDGQADQLNDLFDEWRQRTGDRVPQRQNIFWRTSPTTLERDEWGAAMVRQLADGATRLVARSRAGRILICSDLLGLLHCLHNETGEIVDSKVRECLAIIETGGSNSASAFYMGGWLSVHGDRAAFESDSSVFVVPLPTKRNTLPKEDAEGSVGSILAIDSRHKKQVELPDWRTPIQISYMSLHDDALVTTFLHPANEFTPSDGGVGGTAGQGALSARSFMTSFETGTWDTALLNSVRIIRLTPVVYAHEEREWCEIQQRKDEDDEEEAAKLAQGASQRSESEAWETEEEDEDEEEEEEDEEENNVNDAVQWT